MAVELNCSCCKREREAKGHKPRPLLPFEVGSKTPLLLCENCDGEEILRLVTSNEEDPLS
jgi:hypothetical protein